MSFVVCSIATAPSLRTYMYRSQKLVSSSSVARFRFACLFPQLQPAARRRPNPVSSHRWKLCCHSNLQLRAWRSLKSMCSRSHIAMPEGKGSSTFARGGVEVIPVPCLQDNYAYLLIDRASGVAAAGKRTVQYSTAQHSTAQHSTAQHSTAQHSTAQHKQCVSRLSPRRLRGFGVMWR